MSDDSGFPLGVFDFQGDQDMVRTVSDVLGISEDEVRERLFYEALQPGWNVSRSAKRLGVTPHVYDRHMREFYGRTDAFVFELLRGNQGPGRKRIDQRVVEVMETYTSNRTDVHVLVLGDGIGSDSLRFALMGFRVTYFELEGCCSALATHRFRRQGVDRRIDVVHDARDITPEYYDVVVCREVLEHVEDPPAMVVSIWSCLRHEGIAIITESFSRIEPQHPTHLLENQKYAGKTESMFVERGFRLLTSYPSRRPMVFEKTSTADMSRFDSLPSSSTKAGVPVQHREYLVRKVIRRIGKQVLRLVRM